MRNRRLCGLPSLAGFGLDLSECSLGSEGILEPPVLQHQLLACANCGMPWSTRADRFPLWTFFFNFRAQFRPVLKGRACFKSWTVNYAYFVRKTPFCALFV